MSHHAQKKVFFKPKDYLIQKWTKTLIPPFDVFFFEKLTNIEVIDSKLVSIDKYLSEYSELSYINAYEHWNVKTKAKYVYVDYENNILANSKIRDIIYQQQIKCERGLILDNEENKQKNLKIAYYENKIILSNYLFGILSKKDKEELCIKYARSIDDWLGYVVPNLPNYIKKVANKFAHKDGCNCLAITLYGATNNGLWLKDWTNEESFANQLKELNYEKTNENYCRDDIIIFKKHNEIIHACYCVGDGLFLNKSGQSRFNPIVLLPLENIIKDWENCDYEIYRRKKHKN